MRKPSGVLVLLVFFGALGIALPSGAAPAGSSTQAPSDQRQHAIYQLSYIESDSALALLKTLGYTTIEYQIAPAEDEEDEAPAGDRVFVPTTTGYELPAIIRLIDPAKSHLGPETGTGSGREMPEITSSGPQQRLLIVYERQHLGTVERILNLLREKIDVPARQLLIEGVIVEIGIEDSLSLGIDFGGGIGADTIFSAVQDAATGESAGLAVLFDENGTPNNTFYGRLSALVKKGDAEVLATPSVLVLDGRQVRIQVGSEIPVATATATSAGFSTSVSMVSVGILLNLRPKLSEDGTEVSLQVETSVSEVVSQVTQSDAAGNVLFSAPITGNRSVNSFVRVPADTPFILGGLIQTEDRERISGVPVLSAIPLLGNLFRHRRTERARKELVIILTPHVIPAKQHNLRYLTPRMNEAFDTFGEVLFHNAYRIDDSEVMDFTHVRASAAFRDLQRRVKEHAETNPAILSDELVRSVAAGRVPGEEILVRRMLWELVRDARVAQAIPDAGVYFDKHDLDAPDGSGFTASRVIDELGTSVRAGDALVMTFLREPESSPEHPIPQPSAQVSRQSIGPGGYDELLRRANSPAPSGDRLRSAVVLGGGGVGPGMRHLAEVLVVQELLRLNPALDADLTQFRSGRQLVFPPEATLRTRSFLVGEATARLFYEITHYYQAFEQEFLRQSKSIDHKLAMTWAPATPEPALPTAAMTIGCDEFADAPHLSRTVELLLGQTLELTLCSNRSTGFGWPEVSAFTAAPWLVPLVHAYLPASPDAPPGTAGNETWSLRAAAPGSATFVLEYSQPWDGGDKGARRLELAVVAGPGS